MSVLIHHKEDGTPYARLYLGRDEHGKAIRPYKEFPNMTDEEAVQAADTWKREQERKRSAEGLTTAQALSEYVDHLEALGNSHNTTRNYRHFTNCYLLDLSRKPIAEVTTQDLDGNFQTLLTVGTKQGGKLSGKTVQTYRAFLQGAWKVFVRHGIVTNNVVRDTMRVQATQLEARALDEMDAQKLMKAIKRDLDAFPAQDDTKAIKQRIKALAILLALFTGARVGEVAALRIRDVSHTTNRITISGNVVIANGMPLRQEKTKGKRTRAVTIDPYVSEVLKKHGAWLQGIIATYGKNTPICTIDGEHMRPSFLSQGFTAYRKALGLDAGATFHSLRHTHATMLLHQGVNPRIIQERLGHADVSTTLGIYGHVMPTNDLEAAKTFSNSIMY